MAYGGGMGYHLHMPSYFWRTFTEYPSLRGYELDTFLKELLASLVGMVSASILGSKIRLYFEIRKSLKINPLWLVQGASIYLYIACTLH